MTARAGGPRPSRRVQAVALVAALAVSAILAVRYAGVVGPSPLDLAAGEVVGLLPDRFDAGLRQVVRWLGPLTVAATGLALAAVHLVRRDAVAAIVCGVAPVLTGVATTLLQEVVGRSLDESGAAALPSGHTGGATAAALVLGWTLVRVWPRSMGARVAAVVLPCGAGGSMAVALVRNGLHVVSDTVAGFAVAIAVVSAVALLTDAAWRWATSMLPKDAKTADDHVA